MCKAVTADLAAGELYSDYAQRALVAESSLKSSHLANTWVIK